MPGKSKDRVRKGRVTTCSLCGAVGHRLETCSLPGASEFRRLRKESRAKPRFADKNNKERNAPNKHGSHAKMARKAYSRNPAKTRGRNPRRVIPRGLTLSGIETDAEALEWLLRKKFLKRPAACPDWWLLLPGKSAYQEASLRQRLVPLAVQPLRVSATSFLHVWKLLRRPSERSSALGQDARALLFLNSLGYVLHCFGPA